MFDLSPLCGPKQTSPDRSCKLRFRNSAQRYRRRWIVRSILDHSIKVAARDTAQDPVGPGYLAPAIPDANAHVIGPRASLALGLRDTSVVAGLVAVGAFCQTHPKPSSLRVRERRLLSRSQRHACRRRNAKHQQDQRYFVNVSHRGSSSQSAKITVEGIEQPASLCQGLVCFRPWPGFCASHVTHIT
jgi:hypothetical protein